MTPRRLRWSWLGAAATVLLGATACAPDPPAAVVGVEVTGCGQATGFGGGALIDDGLVLTSAHVIAGRRQITVIAGRARLAADVAAFDPDTDLAVLALSDGSRARTPVALEHERVGAGTSADAYVYRDGSIVRLPVTIVRPIQLATTDIYRDADTDRAAYELTAAIEPGDSGAPVLVGGRLVGVIWARSRVTDDRAYAIDPWAAGATIRGQLSDATIPASIDVTRCP